MRYVVVFDTNVLISALLSPNGKPFQCLKLASEGRVQSVTCQEILDEFQEKLLLKFEYSPQDALTTANLVLNYSQIVTISNTLNVVSTDPDDNMILECAVAESATHIVTGDKRHLLPLGSYQGIYIVTAANFLTLVSST
ncbi:putative toxin-antitoxin system toxin component, PIN family [Iningainema tapete]|uniref:Putative toxin-antitoxin system toxin component, PIN family n=1 Tax=Iningainema tapete BLCC-T55 TaxID=2748662 RepID=A0A8J7BX72_9CYAN|nr:putative toxin-antitoxin system toxin component, PIN family [Iningainema tapete]MBD2773222.1 putative toxin-antitoxin system toxin component, PIN family [Iningainema tapete BLCC-T55]